MRKRVPDAVCELSPGTINTHLLINRAQPPFDNPDLRRVMALTIDRKAYVDTLGQGEGEIGGNLAAASGRVVGYASGPDRQAAGLRPRRAQEPGRGPPP